MGRIKSICVRGLAFLLLVLIAVLILPGCVSVPEQRTGEYFLFTKHQFRLVEEASHANDSHMNPFAIFAPFAISDSDGVWASKHPEGKRWSGIRVRL